MTNTYAAPLPCNAARNGLARSCAGVVEFDDYFGKYLCHAHSIAAADAETAAECGFSYDPAERTFEYYRQA